MANLNRGEYDVTINDVTYTLVLTLGDLEALEDSLTVGASELLTQLARGTARMKDINAIVRRGLLAVKPRLQKQEVDVILKDFAFPFQDRYTAALRLLAGSMNMLDEQREEQKEDEDAQIVEKEKEVREERPLSLVTGGSTGSS